jgi:hypothetical protein
MTDCALIAPTAGRERTRRRARRLPSGIPRWTTLLGVSVVPLEPPEPHRPQDPQAPRAWLISAGAGTSHFAAVFHDGADVDASCR